MPILDVPSVLPEWSQAIKAGIAPGDHVYIGLSGGLDSTVLLDLCYGLASVCSFQLRAVHIHHGLSPLADNWVKHCERLCAERSIPLEVYRVNVQPLAQKSLEAAARAARYQVFSQLSGNLLLLAHHQDDQAETVLYRLVRGAGVDGLAGMPTQRRLSPSLLLWRPLLNVARKQLLQYAESRHLTWIDDPMNEEPHYARAMLRQHILPALRQVNTAASANLQRTANLCRESATLLDQLAQIDWGTSEDLHTEAPVPALSLTTLRNLTELRARNLLRFFLKCHQLPIPSQERLKEWVRQLRCAPRDQKVVLQVGEIQFRLYRNQLYRLPPITPFRDQVWQGEPCLDLSHGRLKFEQVQGQGIAAHWLNHTSFLVAPRRGGEKIDLCLGKPRRTLQSWWQEKGIPPWERTSIPLIFLNHQLVAIPNLGVSLEFQAQPSESGFLVFWYPKL